jgi:hypothetical protein
MRDQFTLKTLLTTTAIIAVCCAAAVAIKQSIVGRNHYASKLGVHIDSLYGRRPANLNAARWDCMVDWTHNLHCNSLIAFQTSTAEIASFEARLDERLSGKVDVATIEWIWDEYANVCRGGQAYQRFRLSANEDLIGLKSPVLLEPPTTKSKTEGG